MDSPCEQRRSRQIARGQNERSRLRKSMANLFCSRQSAFAGFDTPNLYAAARAAYGDKYAGGSLRVMGTTPATGNAAGVAAALHAAAGNAVSALQVQQELQKQDARLAGVPA